MTQPNELIETIEKALEAATPGPWITGVCTKDDINIQGSTSNHMVTLRRRTTVVAFTGPAGDDQSARDAFLIANSPTWLRALLEENKRLQSVEHTLCLTIGEADKVLQQTREELEQVKAERDELREFWKGVTLDQAKEYIESIQSLRTELSAKDKVLEWYAEQENHSTEEDDGRPTPISRDNGDKARTILSQYPKGDTHESYKTTP
ncbi:hypothetical protein [Cohnella sp. GCM10027633]|uniref:hypothetical protein n=1 Tax=unclassified Cohnella TaxID=2636738 RepID=UPI003642370B